MYGKYFEYNGHSSEEFNLMLAGMNQIKDIPLGMSRDILRGSINRYRSNPNHMGTQWSDVLSFQITAIKNLCNTPDDIYFTEDEINSINKWLTSPDYPLLFHMYDEQEKIHDTDKLFLYVSKDGLVSGDDWIEASAEGTIHETNDPMLMMFRFKYKEEETICEVENPELHYFSVIRNEKNYLVFEFDGLKDDNFNIRWIEISGIRYTKDADFLDNGGSNETSFLFTDLRLSAPHTQYDYFGVFNNVESQVIGDQIVGLTLSFATNSPFAWTEEKISTFSCTDDGTDITITVDNAEEMREVFPLIEVRSTDPGASSRYEVEIINNDDIESITYEYDEENNRYNAVETPRSLKITVPHTYVYIDSRMTKIYDIVDTVSGGVNNIFTFEDLGLEDVSYIYWPRLFEGENNWTVKGNCSLTVRYREPRKVGAY